MKIQRKLHNRRGGRQKPSRFRNQSTRLQGYLASPRPVSSPFPLVKARKNNKQSHCTSPRNFYTGTSSRRVEGRHRGRGVGKVSSSILHLVRHPVRLSLRHLVRRSSTAFRDHPSDVLRGNLW